jgi:hypothetical protein
MHYLPVTLEQVINNGGNLIVGEGYLPQTLKNLAQIAKTKKLRLTIKDQKLLPQTMIEIAKIGDGFVTFDVS